MTIITVGMPRGVFCLLGVTVKAVRITRIPYQSGVRTAPRSQLGSSTWEREISACVRDISLRDIPSSVPSLGFHFGMHQVP